MARRYVTSAYPLMQHCSQVASPTLAEEASQEELSEPSTPRFVTPAKGRKGERQLQTRHGLPGAAIVLVCAIAPNYRSRWWPCSLCNV